MKRKMFMAAVMSIVLALGMLGQAVAAKVITPSPYEPAPASSLVLPPFPVHKGGVPNLCSYSSFIPNYYTIRCATDIEFSSSGFYVTGSRILNLNLYDKIDTDDLVVLIDYFAKTYSYYRDELDKFLRNWNLTDVTWDELNNYALTRTQIGSDAGKVITEWEFVKSDLGDVNFFIDAWIL